MKKFAIFLFLVISFNPIIAQYDWNKISYSHSAGSNSDKSRVYYIIDIDNKGNGKLEFFSSGKPEIKEFKVSKKNLSYLNSEIRKTGIFKIDPKDLISENSVSNEYIYTMTVTLEREFGEKYEFKRKKKLNPGKDDIESDKKEKEEGESEKLEVIPVPNNISAKYKKDFYNLYNKIELVVPGKVWKDVGVD